MSYFQAMGSLGIDLSPTCDANGQNCEYVRTPTGPGQSMPTGAQPVGTVLQCEYDASNPNNPGTCYYAYPGGTLATVNVSGSDGLTPALKANAPATFAGIPINTLVMFGIAGLVGVVVLSAVKGK